jgi:transglutaminase-like putative cysteine protease
MQLTIEHHTQYTFSEPVYLEPHVLLFRPQVNHFTEIKTFELHIDPEPKGLRHFTDPADNQATMVWFDTKQTKVTFEALCTVDLKAFNPYDFLVYPFDCATLPFTYPPELSIHLQPYFHPISSSAEFVDFAHKLKQQFGPNTMDFLSGSSNRLHQLISHIERETGAPHTPEHTMHLGNGSCRDLAWLQMAINRHLGLACRFVSGYKYNEEETGHELHAWTETYVPGAGWVGTDPSNGLLAGYDHIKVASGAEQLITLPVTGTFRGDASSKMTTRVLIEKID